MVESFIQCNFPRIKSAILRNFSLYSTCPEINITPNKGVFCLAGANGLGKSTFLTILNYSLTGIVINPEKKFNSVSEWFQSNKNFSDDFFSGRVDESDREAAEVELEIEVGSKCFKIIKGIFEPEELRMLEIYSATNSLDFDAAELMPQARFDEYKKRLIQSVGLQFFEQFVFLQYFVFTFDERRHLLFWDEKVLEQALYIVFGVDLSEANRADALRREEERADSLARNFSWQATEVRKKLNVILEALGETQDNEKNDEDIVEEYKKLVEINEQKQSTVERSEKELKDVELRLSELSAQQIALQAQYADEFSKSFQENLEIKKHALIAVSVRDSECGLCHSKGEIVVNNIKLATEGTCCPLCKSELKNSKEAKQPDFEKLKEIDEALFKVKTKIDELIMSKKRLSEKLRINREESLATMKKLQNFEQANQTTIEQFRLMKDKANNVTNDLIKAYRLQIEELTNKKNANYIKRNQKRDELEKLQIKLSERYYFAEETFLPLFRDLAFEFLGIDLNVKLENSSRKMTLVLEVKNKARRQQHQLSESQRFFVDIALRMALTKRLSSMDSNASLFIDTPEGSLDIAYEYRAGSMLAKFIKQGFNIIMTANINSSGLLKALAQECGHKKMTLCRMTTWTDLSEVQVEEEELFRSAYREIEEALGRGGKPSA